MITIIYERNSCRLHKSSNEIGGTQCDELGRIKRREDRVIIASVGEIDWGGGVSKSLTGMRGGKARGGRSDLGYLCGVARICGSVGDMRQLFVEKKTGRDDRREGVGLL